ncbi:Lipopolysaccharide export system protein LptA [Defluviimonas aquaemixtae]|uniref:Lipopolysaccharide export system protein LptA n=1 Tax=Albidovulum aquaemixtae TaxID=1542388 RepID=A0A2R8BJR6_9RHOB|nr:lipopolysaccharide transport periplasmic protein LptA [Defluviimonas aquaemixtae]SPH23614.1 Lipopolysaccharide export system protein LptA [Defluviimonas aquaemixtae]
MPVRLIALIAATALAVLPAAMAAGQGASVAFGGLRADTGLPVEVTADQLTVDQNDGTAVFSGNVLVGQGEMRLSAAEVVVEYGGEDQSRIERLHATGGVTLVSGAEAAEAEEAVYTIDSGEVVMTGNVLLVQGANTLSGQKLIVDLSTGTGRMEGRVKTVLQPSGGN